MRAVGGKLHVTDQRLVFLPQGFDKSLAGKDWSAALSSIREVGEAPMNPRHFFGGGLRKRLRVSLADGGEELFVVGKLGEVVEELRQAAAQRGSRPSSE